jgi:hypothetical protein
MRSLTHITHVLKQFRGPVQSAPADGEVVIRHARADEADALDTLAQLDSSRAPRGDVLVADVEGELWAAVSIDDGHAVADPFRPTGELTFRLSERARELHLASRRVRGSRARARVRAA